MNNMLNKKLQLNEHALNPDKLKSEPTRNGFGRGLVEAGEANDNVVALCADLAESTRMQDFKDTFPKRYIELGVAEQNLAAVGSGMAAAGKIPFIASYATFSPGRNNEQIRTTISLNKQPVKIVGSHAGLSVGPDGATHQALEDIGLMRMQPNMTVLVPADAEEARKATIAAAEYDGPVYIRLSRAGFPVFTTTETPFEIGKAQIVYESDNPVVGIIVCGSLVHESIMAAHNLSEQGIGVSVMNLATIKPLDRDAVVAFAKQCGAIVTVEEHQCAGGMGSAVAECLAEHHPVPMKFVGVQDKFGQSGEPHELIKEYGLDSDSIMKTVEQLVKKNA